MDIRKIAKEMHVPQWAVKLAVEGLEEVALCGGGTAWSVNMEDFEHDIDQPGIGDGATPEKAVMEALYNFRYMYSE